MPLWSLYNLIKITPQNPILIFKAPYLGLGVRVCNPGEYSCERRQGLMLEALGRRGDRGGGEFLGCLCD